MISGGKYWPAAGSGAAKATTASAAAHRRAFAFIDAFLVCDLLAAARLIDARSRGGNPIWSRPTQFAYSRRPLRICAAPCELRPQQMISAHRPEEPSSALLPYPAQKRNSPIAARKIKTRDPSPRCMFATSTRISRVNSGPRRNQQAQRTDELEGDYFPPVFASASLQPSLRSAACDFMHCARLPLPGLASAQSFFSSALQALPTAAARMIAT